MTPRFFVSDLDGTILDQDGGLPDEFEDLLDLLGRSEISFVPATSRSPQNVVELFAGRGAIEWAICSDGATTICPDGSGFRVHSEKLLSRAAATEAVGAVVRGAEGKAFVPLVFAGAEEDFRVLIGPLPADVPLAADLRQLLGDGRPIAHGDLEELLALPGRLGVRAVSLFGDFELLSEAASPLVDTPLPSTTSYLYPETRIAGDLGWLDIHDSGVNKAHAIRSLLDEEDGELVAVLGNGANDVEALQLCEESICPSDAVEVAQSAARRMGLAPAGAAFVAEVCELLGQGDWIGGSTG